MNKIIKSVFTLTVVASLAVGLSLSYFNDTETSIGNTFTAGAIDLTVDSKAHYNGLECIGGVWSNNCYPVQPELIENGGFEVPEVVNTAKWEIFSSIPGWTIEWESTETSYGGVTRPEPALQEYHENVLGPAAEGDQYAELDTDWQGPSGSLNGEPALVRIYQNITTTPGKKYELRYYYSPRPNVTAADNTLIVRIDGVQVATHSRNGLATTDWSWEKYQFEAVSPSTKIEFAGGGTANSLGVFLDGVSVYGLYCESDFYEYEGLACGGTWELTDLGATNKFFDYADIKPGDEGENTISLHIDNNPAYACVYFTNLEDNDLGLTEPEAKEDDSDGAGYGELSEHIDVFMWLEEDGDNVWEEGEAQLGYQAPAFLTWDNMVYGLALPSTEPLLPGETSYLGIYWCAGSMIVDAAEHTLTCNANTMGNEAQTGELKVDISFYVEQTRHNENFECRLSVVDDNNDLE